MNATKLSLLLLLLLASTAPVHAEPSERYPETRSRMLQPEDVRGWNDAKLRYAINEMYARHGADFKDRKIKEWFLRFDWYHPRPGMTYDEAEAEFSDIEKDNVRLLGESRAKPQSSSPLEAPFKLPANGSYTVELLQKPLPGADPNNDFFTLAVFRNGKVIAKVPTFGYLLEARWSPDGKYVAVNNRRGNSGDYIWIFALPSGKILKKPDDAVAEAWKLQGSEHIAKSFPETKDKESHHAWLTAQGWKKDRLQVYFDETFIGSEERIHFEGTADPADWKTLTDSKVSTY